MIGACGFDIQKQYQATSHIKLQDLGSASKRFNTDPSSLLPITSTILCQEVTTRASEKPAQHASRDLQGAIHHKTSMLADRYSLGTMVESSLASTSIQDIGYKNQVQDSLIDNNRVRTPENSNELTWMVCSSIHSLEDDFNNKENARAISNSKSKEQDGELLMYHHERHLVQEEQSIKLSFPLYAKLEGSETAIAGDGAPSRFLQVADVGNQLQDQDRILIKTKRAELALSPSKEKLRILDNIYNAMYQWKNTLWAYECEQVWNPGLVFSTIEAARGGDEEVKALLKSKDSGSRLLICCEAICELMHAFPPESLVPEEFVKECLLATSGVKPDVHEWVRNNQLTTYQDVDSSMFWDSLTQHAMYLVKHELATAKQIASIFTGILLPASRLKDLSKGKYESARLNLHIFIAILLGAKDAAAASFEAKGCISNGGQDCHTQIALYKDDSGLEMKERDGCAVSPLLTVPTCGTDQAVNELSSTSSAPASSPSCLSFSMLIKCLPWKKSRVKDG